MSTLGEFFIWFRPENGTCIFQKMKHLNLKMARQLAIFKRKMSSKLPGLDFITFVGLSYIFLGKTNKYVSQKC